jgi:hypothetical protein
MKLINLINEDLKVTLDIPKNDPNYWNGKGFSNYSTSGIETIAKGLHNYINKFYKKYADKDLVTDFNDMQLMLNEKDDVIKIKFGVQMSYNIFNHDVPLPVKIFVKLLTKQNIPFIIKNGEHKNWRGKVITEKSIDFITIKTDDFLKIKTSNL